MLRRTSTEEKITKHNLRGSSFNVFKEYLSRYKLNVDVTMDWNHWRHLESDCSFR